jgi:hypothetical protein
VAIAVKMQYDNGFNSLVFNQLIKDFNVFSDRPILRVKNSFDKLLMIRDVLTNFDIQT